MAEMSMDRMGDAPDDRKAGGKLARGGAAMDMKDDDRDDAKKGGRTRSRRASGGTTTNVPVKSKERIFKYNAPDSPTVSEAVDRKPSFKDGGDASGEMGRRRHDRHQRGGSARTPYSSGAQLSPPKDDRAGKGFEGDGQA